jgi:hypothetical protein
MTTAGAYDPCAAGKVATCAAAAKAHFEGLNKANSDDVKYHETFYGAESKLDWLWKVTPMSATGAAAVAAVHKNWWTLFPDLKITFPAVCLDEATGTAVLCGELTATPAATGKTIKFEASLQLTAGKDGRMGCGKWNTDFTYLMTTAGAYDPCAAGKVATCAAAAKAHFEGLNKANSDDVKYHATFYNAESKLDWLWMVAPMSAVGPEAVAAVHKNWWTLFPDLKVTFPTICCNEAKGTAVLLGQLTATPASTGKMIKFEASLQLTAGKDGKMGCGKWNTDFTYLMTTSGAYDPTAAAKKE